MSSNSKLKTICYFGICDMNYSRNKVFGDALKHQGIHIIECTSKKTGLAKYFDLWKKHNAIKNNYDAVIVGFPGFVIAQFARTISKKKVILDALSSRYDSDIVSRNAHEGSFFKKIKIILIDWLAFTMSHAVLVESEVQKAFIAQKFHIKKSKLYVAYTGVNEEVYIKDESISKHEIFTVLFRGRIMSEAGVPIILKAAALLKDENINFDIIGYGWGPWIEESRVLYAGLDHHKVLWTEKEIPFAELIPRMQKAHISLGQFGSNERVSRTIPHKAYESMILGLPYITGESKAVGEVMLAGTSCVMIPAYDPQALAQAILELKNNSDVRANMALEAGKRYTEHFSSLAIGRELVQDIHTIIGA